MMPGRDAVGVTLRSFVGEKRYGQRKAVVEGEDWEGPAFQTCVSFSHHAEAASLPPAEADALLDWAEEAVATTGRRRDGLLGPSLVLASAHAEFCVRLTQNSFLLLRQLNPPRQLLVALCRRQFRAMQVLRDLPKLGVDLVACVIAIIVVVYRTLADALKIAARLPSSYEAAKRALAQCDAIDECKEWSDRMAALASYARQAKDEELLHKARRIQARALRRSGELLEQIAPARGPNQNIQAGSHPNVFTRTDAAREAGFSEHQQKQAMRLANIPEDEFEAAIEGEKPPTVTELAERGHQGQFFFRACAYIGGEQNRSAVMVKRHARRRKKAAMQTSQTEAERLALIPGGPVNPHRAARDRIDLEDRAATDRGTALIVGQIVSTQVRKLLMQNHISLEEAAAAHLFAKDHDAAYASMSNPLAALSAACTRVDGGVVDRAAVMERKAHHGLRFRRASQHLRSEMASIAAAAILQHAGAGNDVSYTAIGADLLPRRIAAGAARRRQRGRGSDAARAGGVLRPSSPA